MIGPSMYTSGRCSNVRGYLNRLAKLFKKEGVPLSELALDLSFNSLKEKEKEVHKAIVDLQRLGRKYRIR